jgi:lycopene beta-cyclase
MTVDLALLGGGLANGLLAYRLATTRPEVSFALIEKGTRIGANHTWCFHESDVSPAVFEWLQPLISYRWSKYRVTFPQYTREIEGTYCCVTSDDFHKRLSSVLKDRIFLSTSGDIDSAAPHSLKVDGAPTFSSRAVVDGRGFAPVAGQDIGYQKFFGHEVELASAHGISSPQLMDARIEQEDGFRFIYVLPFSPTRLLLEDTCYSDSPELSVPKFRARLEAYAQQQGFQVDRVVREEAGALPIVLGGQRIRQQHPCIGLKGGFFNAATGYSFATAAQVADRIARLPSLDNVSLTRSLEAFSSSHWQSQAFFRILNRMLFRSGLPHLRMQVIEAFYRNSSPLVARFYAGNLTLADKLNILIKGAPTVPMLPAMRAAMGFR